MTPEPISGHVVEHFLKISWETLDDWHQASFLTWASDNRRCFHEADLDRVLAREARNFETPPTFADLVTGKVRLLTPQEAAAILGVDPGYLSRLVKRGFLKAVKYQHALRYCEASVKHRAAMLKSFNTRMVAHIFGISVTTISRLEAQQLLIRKPGKENNRYTSESVFALLKAMLPPHQCPEDWIQDRFASSQKLLSVDNLVLDKQDHGRVKKLLDQGEFHYIHQATPSGAGRRLISPDSHLAYLERTAAPITEEDLTQLFGVSARSIRSWDRDHSGWRICPIHNHPDEHLYKDCIVLILERYLTPGASAIRWYRSRLESKIPLIDSKEAARILGFKCKKIVVEMTHAGKIEALKTPGRMLRYSRVTIVGTRDRRNAKRKAARSN